MRGLFHWCGRYLKQVEWSIKGLQRNFIRWSTYHPKQIMLFLLRVRLLLTTPNLGWLLRRSKRTTLFVLYVIDHDVMEVGSSVVVVAYTTPTWRSGVFDDNGDDDDGDDDDDDDDDIRDLFPFSRCWINAKSCPEFLRKLLTNSILVIIFNF